MPFWIDTDNALGSPRGDVDDAFALAALLTAGAPVAALSSVAGNTSEPRAFTNTRRLAELCGYSGPILRGASTPDLPGRIDRAVDLWGDPARPLRLLALGPLTNVAAVLAAAQRLGMRPALSEVVLVGSNLSSRGRWPPLWPHEFNLTKDRSAARAVFASDLPLTVVPLDIARRLSISRSDLFQLSGDLGAYLRRGSARWLRRATLLRGHPRFAVFDLAAAAYALDPTLVETRETTARVNQRLWLEYGRGGRAVRVVTDLDRGAIWRRFVGWVNGPAAPG
jgi:inosine-uridine nucleoside N-ribohydrolase